jgi:hypothetical protein
MALMDDLRRLGQADGLEYQLSLGLEVDDVGDEALAATISVDEARLRSETARVALRTRFDEAAAQRQAQGVEIGDWTEQYFKLLDAGFPWRVACYIAWAASPKRNRWPKTQDELAHQVLGLTSDRVIGTWRKKNAAIDQTVSLLQAAPLLEHRADLFAALAVSASDPDHRHNPDRKLMAEMLGDYTPRQKVEVGRSGEAVDLGTLSDAELDQLAKRVLNE